MPIELTPRDRRALAAAVLVLAPLLIWQHVLVPGAAELYETRNALGAERDLLARELALLAAVPARTSSSHALVEALVTYAPRVFGPHTSPADHVRELAAARNVSIEHIDRLPPPDGADLRPGLPVHQTTLRLVGESDLEGVLSLLGALQADERLLVADEIDLSAGRPVESPAPETLRVVLVVRAFTSAPAREGEPPR